ncbi:hypothetical protein GCM10011611_65480 [Aliidongia dinghuensis]|uniref:Uncharacterized protein n=1 Tax=Aliidongia dinghuensis TaxID=1867774 RepID=A0A8J2Z0F1_9PROT|nr:hypothetical protein [Aliidongia dinghuensis]GGF49982.1 hypothetical protein GCM10011611_65480 [Aliidongia dinghuensis]
MRPYERAGIEPDLQEILTDPVLHAVMKRDGVTTEALRAAVRTAQIRLGLVAPVELVSSEEPQERRGRMPAIFGGRDGAGPWAGAGRCRASGPLQLKCA